MVVLTFSVSGLKHLFCANLIQKIKSVGLNWNLVLKLIIEHAEFNGGAHFFCFILEAPVLVNEGKRRATLYLRPYQSRDLEIDSCQQNDFFILLRWARPWTVFVHYLKSS